MLIVVCRYRCNEAGVGFKGNILIFSGRGRYIIISWKGAVEVPFREFDPIQRTRTCP